jgi:hypothetical protein
VTISYQPGAAATQPTPADDGSWEQKVLLCHRLDVTFDRPIYFNQFGKTDEAPKPDPKKKPGESDRAKLKRALCTPIPDDEAAKLPGPVNREVIYLDLTMTKANKVARAQRIEAQQLDVNNDDREQQVFATGPGRVRILQLGSKEGFGAPSAPPQRGQPAPKGEQEMKLTLVKFTSRMVAKEKGKVYQEAVFDDGARVWNVPTDNINLQFDEHNPPPRTTFLACTESLTVSSSRAKPGATPEQWMKAKGSGEFQTEDYIGFGTTITYDGEKAVLEGTDKRLAELYRRRTGVNNRQHHSARMIFYYRDGTIRTSDSASGAIDPGR